MFLFADVFPSDFAMDTSGIAGSWFFDGKLFLSRNLGALCGFPVSGFDAQRRNKGRHTDTPGKVEEIFGLFIFCETEEGHDGQATLSHYASAPSGIQVFT